MKTKRAIQSDFDKAKSFPAGTEVVLVEAIGKAVWVAEVRTPDVSQAGGMRLDTVTVHRDDLEW